VTQVIECLLSNDEVLSSSPSTVKKKLNHRLVKVYQVFVRICIIGDFETHLMGLSIGIKHKEKHLFILRYWGFDSGPVPRACSGSTLPLDTCSSPFALLRFDF
jgi:hypothetical protein